MRELLSNYRSEAIFFVCLAALATVSHLLSQYIPQDFFDTVLTPIQNSFTIAVCLVGAFLLFRHSDGLRFRKVWAWTMLIWGLVDSFFLLQTCVLDMPVLVLGADALTAYDLLAGNLLGWLLLLYPTETLRPGWINGRHAALQLLPMVALVVLDYLVPVSLTPIIALYPAVLAGLLLSHIRAYRIWCEQNYSTMDSIDVQWIVRYLIMLAVIGASFLYMCVTDNPVRSFTQQWLLLCFFAYGTEQILFRKDPWDELKNERLKDEGENPTGTKSAGLTAERSYSASNLTSNSASGLLLRQWMEREKPYLNPEFQLMDLRQVLPMNRTYLSEFVKNTYGCTFYQFVNRYRVEEAKRLIRECPETKMADVASGAGFSSQSTFTKIFINEAGCTPSEWRTKFSSE